MPETLDSCPVCGSKDIRSYFGVMYEDRCFVLCECGAAFLNPRPTEEENIEWYRSGAYRERTAKFADEELELRHQHMRGEYISEIVRDAEISSHLDIGCSSGELLKQVQEGHPGITSIGVDVDPVFTKYAADLTIFPSINDVRGKFDLITLIHTLEHITYPVPFIKDIIEKLSPGGILAIEVPNRRAYMVAYSAPEHVIAYDLTSLMGLTKRLGLIPMGYELQGWIQGSPMDLCIDLFVTNDREKYLERFNTDNPAPSKLSNRIYIKFNK